MPERSPARAARESAGLSAPDVAHRAGVSVAYLRQVERRGVPYVLALRLASIYGCGLGSFLPGGGGTRSGGGRAGTEPASLPR